MQYPNHHHMVVIGEVPFPKCCQKQIELSPIMVDEAFIFSFGFLASQRPSDSSFCSLVVPYQMLQLVQN